MPLIDRPAPVDVVCDGAANCPNDFTSPTRAALLPSLERLGWLVDGEKLYCPFHVQQLQAAGKLGPRGQ